MRDSRALTRVEGMLAEMIKLVYPQKPLFSPSWRLRYLLTLQHEAEVRNAVCTADSADTGRL